MTPDVIIAAIKDALGNPSGGAVAEAMPLISGAVNQAMGVRVSDSTTAPAGDPSPADTADDDKKAGAPTKGTETRVIKATETR